MRKVIYGAACSLDGFLAGPGGALDWLYFSQDLQQLMAQTWSRVDTLLFGRKTWESPVAQGGPGAASAELTTYVFSRSLRELSGGARLVSQEAGAFVAALKQQPGGDLLVMSGGDLLRSLLKAGVVDEVGLNVHPLLLGSGTPVFLDGGGRVRLELLECRTLAGGCVTLHYEVLG